MMANKLQTNNSLSQVDSLAAFLSKWAESNPDQTTPPNRPFSLQPITALPSGVLRRRNDGYGNISNDGSSLLFQLHESEEAEEQNLSRSSENGNTSSPCGVRVVWHRESVPMVAGASGGNGVPPLPFPVTRNEQATQQLPSTSSSRLASSPMEHHLQGSGVPSERSSPFRSYKKAARVSRRHSDPGTNPSCLY